VTEWGDCPTSEEWEGATARERQLYLRSACDSFLLTSLSEAACMSHEDACGMIRADAEKRWAWSLMGKLDEP
jgi:hypothetical protein